MYTSLLCFIQIKLARYYFSLSASTLLNIITLKKLNNVSFTLDLHEAKNVSV